ncbi:hypothetical protein [Sphingobium sp. B12D2B]|uniref:hypothetical protein n=1 Tax=Sphingobium sp. B12D2B TaxID=2940577 RepID=UPI0022242FA0|nr:hypothetical protein [Sphingobium sp. B12D2B]MCW2348568.1 putative membrane protein [Sphingobium sp. B12D2B]
MTVSSSIRMGARLLRATAPALGALCLCAALPASQVNAAEATAKGQVSIVEPASITQSAKDIVLQPVLVLQSSLRVMILSPGPQSNESDQNAGLSMAAPIQIAGGSNQTFSLLVSQAFVQPGTGGSLRVPIATLSDDNFPPFEAGPSGFEDVLMGRLSGDGLLSVPPFLLKALRESYGSDGGPLLVLAQYE